MEKRGEIMNKSILDIYKQIKTGTLLLRPYYQRRLVWTKKDKEDFIETILKGYPFPEIYECQGVLDTKQLDVVYYVVDGQQRITTIRDYMEGELSFDRIRSFQELSEEEKSAFLNYIVVVRQLGAIDDVEMKEIFFRLNKTDYTLKKAELIYSQYQGVFISLAREQAEKRIGFFDIILGEKSISRMADISFILQIMCTIENGIYFTGEKEIERYVDMYNERYDNYSQMNKTLDAAFDLFMSLDLPFDSLFYKKASSFSLLVELCKTDSQLDVNIISKSIKEFECLLLANKDKDMEANDFAAFYRYLYQGTASKKARDTRGNMIRKYILLAN